MNAKQAQLLEEAVKTYGPMVLYAIQKYGPTVLQKVKHFFSDKPKGHRNRHHRHRGRQDNYR